MVTTDENVINLQDSEIRFIIGDSETLTETKHGNFNGYHKDDVKLHCTMLYDTDIMLGLHENITMK